jgi:hypothetical protein
MARGPSGRIVLEIDPGQKVELYKAIEKNGMTLKEWFLRQVGRYLSEQAHPELFTTGLSKIPTAKEI